MICVSVLAETNQKALRRMARGFALADMVELRIDRIPTPDLPALVGARKKKLLVTSRRKEEGGFFAGPEKERVNLLAEAGRLGADYVDIEASTGERLICDLVGKISGPGKTTKMIVSHHELRGTPTWRNLRRRYKACQAFGARVVKIVTYAHSVEDNLRVLRLIPESLAEGQAIVAFCMGPRGRISRLLAPLLGSCISYASLANGAESAPGQLTVAEMRRALRCLTSVVGGPGDPETGKGTGPSSGSASSLGERRICRPGGIRGIPR
jgi:3-dehydroquinate dehydratase type I